MSKLVAAGLQACGRRVADTSARWNGRMFYAGERVAFAQALAEDEAIAARTTLLVTVPNTLVVDYSAHVIESILKYVAPELGWRCRGSEEPSLELVRQDLALPR